MRVTKIMREYIERTVKESYNAKINTLEKPVEFTQTVEYNDFKDWISKEADDLYERILAKADECGIKLKLEGDSYYNSYHKFGDRICPDKYEIFDEKVIEYEEKVAQIRKERDDKINEILIGLEIGDLNKQKLEEVLAPFKQ